MGNFGSGLIYLSEEPALLLTLSAAEWGVDWLGLFDYSLGPAYADIPPLRSYHPKCA